jgi:hypothetical protein
VLEFLSAFRFPILPVLALSAALPLAAQFSTRLSPKTDQAFDDYRKAVETQFEGRPRFPAGLKPGQIQVVPARNQGAIDVPDGLIHDWIAATVVSGATVEKTLAVLQNYAAYKHIYRSAVLDSKLLRRDGDVFHVSLRLLKTKVLKVELNADFDVQYRPLGNNSWSVMSRSTRIAELEDGQELPAGGGRGFLWHQNAYWLIEPRPEGVYLECRSLSLSRDIPFGLSLLVKPFLTSVPRESLQQTLEDTIRAVR